MIEILLIGVSGILCKKGMDKIKVPSLIGLLCIGILIGPYMLSLISEDLMRYAHIFRSFALIVILMKAGFSLHLKELKKIGVSTLFMCFIPALFELAAIVIFAPMLLPISRIDAFVLGSVVAAVSPAVIVPRMIQIKEEGYGVEKGIPQMILASASLDDIFVMVLFSSFLQMSLTQTVRIQDIIQVPFSILISLFIGFSIGYALKKIPSSKCLCIASIGIACITMALEKQIQVYIPFTALLTIMMMAFMMKKNDDRDAYITKQFNSIWYVAEIFLFVFIGAAVNPNLAISKGFKIIALLCISLSFRAIGVWISVSMSHLTKNEKLFCIISFMPKATVQAAIGAIPLSMGLASGEWILAIAVTTILITAPIGAILIEKTYQKLLLKYR